jgi:hypothetical protein
MKEFTTAAREVFEEEETTGVRPGDVEFKVKREFRNEDGEIETAERVCIAHRPNDGQVAYLMSQVNAHARLNNQIAGVINFFAAVLDENDRYYITDRLLDIDDEFGIEEVQDIMQYLVEEWSGKSGRSSSGSTSSPKRSGARSTARTPAST